MGASAATVHTHEMRRARERAPDMAAGTYGPAIRHIWFTVQYAHKAYCTFYRLTGARLSAVNHSD